MIDGLVLILMLRIAAIQPTRSQETSTILFQSETNLLQTPSSLTSTNGLLSTNWTLEPSSFHLTPSNITITTRLFNGQYPGPTLRLSPGSTLRLNFTNALSDQNAPYVHNVWSAPDETNLHFHGLHVSGELPGDDALLVIGPGEGYRYEVVVPEEHMGGTHWMHTHRHGSTTLQLGGGAFSAIIVEDAPDTVPSVVAQAKEVIFLAHSLKTGIAPTAQLMSDKLFSIQTDEIDWNADPLPIWTYSGRDELITINGGFNPIVEADAGEWMRFRILWAAWTSDTLNLTVDGCEANLLAKDGIYVGDFPRKISQTRILHGGRADVMVRCPEVEKEYEIVQLGKEHRTVVATIRTSETRQDTPELEPWTPTYPSYLRDLQIADPSPGCVGQTEMDGKEVNGKKFDPDSYLHETYLNAVVERHIFVDNHPYHQHVYPFQLIDGFDDPTGYYRAGDWHDTIDGKGVIRYQPKAYAGKIVVHCHILQHSDKGMMALEYVNAAEDGGTGECVSESLGYPRPTSETSSAASAGVACVSLGVVAVMCSMALALVV